MQFAICNVMNKYFLLIPEKKWRRKVAKIAKLRTLQFRKNDVSKNTEKPFVSVSLKLTFILLTV